MKIFNTLIEILDNGKNNKFNKRSCDTTSNKICNNCKINKSASEFKIRKLHSGRLTLNYICKDCETLKARKLRSNPIYKANEAKSARKLIRKFPEKEMLRRTLNRARKLNLKFNLEITDIHIPKMCPILEIPLFITIGVAGNNSPSLDRINPKLGYIKGNIKVISRMDNTMKAHATKEQILLFCKNIQNYYQGSV